LNIQETRIQKGEKKDAAENVLKEIIAENFTHLAKDINLDIKEAKAYKNRRNKESHIKIYHNELIKIKDKEQNLRAVRTK
jgi:hypothetical protein